MAISVNPVAPVFDVSAFAQTNAPAGVSTYEQLLALEAENNLLEIGASSASGASDASLLSADLLDLSPAALNILNGIDNTAPTPVISANDNIAVGVQPLTPAQQQQAAAIVAQFAASPATPQTFAQITAALTAAGLNPQQVSIQQLLGAYEYAYTPGYAFNEQLYTDTLAEQLDAA